MKTIAGHLFELFVVFLGVYLAFLATDYQEELSDRAIRVKYYDSLIREFQGLVAHLDHEDRKLQAHLAVIEEIDAGNRPHIPASDLTYIYPGAVVAAAMEGENFASLDSRILNSIIGGRPGLTLLEEQIRILNQLTANVLLPIQLTREDCCYREDGSLRPELAWYPRIIQEIRRMNRQLHAAVKDRAIPDLVSSKAEVEALFAWPL